MNILINFFKKLSEFFQSPSGDMSSKRLGYLSTIPFATYGTYKICLKLIEKGDIDAAINIWNSFFIFSCFLGGYVTFDAVITLVRIIKGKEVKDEPAA